MNRKKTKKNRQKISKKKKKQLRRKEWLKIGLFAFLLSVVLNCLFLLVFFSFGRMDGFSMEPTVRNSAFIIVQKFKEVESSDLVYIKVPGTNNRKSVRRIIGKPGDRISFRDDELYVNEQETNEPYLVLKKKQVYPNQLTEDFSLEELINVKTVPDDYYFVMGDNRLSASDSRYYGLVPKKNIIGKLIYYSKGN